MKLLISKKHLYQTLSSVGRASSNFSPLPILSGIKFEAFNDTLTLIASDSNISIKERIHSNENNNLQILAEGELVLEARYIMEAIRKIDNDTISIEVIDGALTRISAGKTEYLINGSHANLYPNIDFTKPDNEFNLSSKKLQTIINQTAFVCSSSEDRPIFTGVNFKAQGNELECVATDSYRLARKTVELPLEQNFNVCVPATSLHEVAKSLGEAEESITIAISNRVIQFYVGESLIQSRLIDGLFPDMNQLIPNNFGFELSVKTQDFIQAVDRSSFLKSDGYWTVKLEANNEEITLSSKSQEIGSSQEIVTPLDYIGGHLKISFSGKYIIEALKSLRCEVANILFVGEMSGFVVKNPEDDSIVQLILPVRTFD